MFRSVTMHDRPAKNFCDLDIAGQHELLYRLDIFQYVFFKLIGMHAHLALSLSLHFSLFNCDDCRKLLG